MLAYQTGISPFAGDPLARPVSAYDVDLGKATEGSFDRETGESVSQDRLKSYRDTLAQYHLHPESKFHNGDYADRGFTRRRHVRAMVTEYIGNEANRWEEQLHLGLDPEVQTGYGIAPDDEERILAVVRRAGEKFGQRKLAQASCISISEVSAILLGKRRPNRTTLSKLYKAVSRLETEAREQGERVREVLEAVRSQCQRLGLRHFAKRAKLDAANLAHVLSGQRKPSHVMLAKLEATLLQALKRPLV